MNDNNLTFLSSYKPATPRRSGMTVIRSGSTAKRKAIALPVKQKSSPPGELFCFIS